MNDMLYSYVKLSDMASYSNKRIKSSHVDENNYISTENMIPNRGGVTEAGSVPDGTSFAGYGQGNILLSNIRPYFKKIWYADKEGGCSNDVLVLKANEDVNSKFLYYVLSDNNFFNYDTVTSKGTKMPRGSKNAIMKYLVPDVSREKQDKIAEILSRYDDLIENNNKRIKILEQMAEELYKEWFVRFRFPGYEETEFEDGIPAGWQYCTVESLAKLLKRGISPDYDDNGTFTVISQKCIRTKIMEISESRRQNKRFDEALNLKDGDTVICSTGTGTLGRVGQVYGNFPNTTFDSHVTLVRANDNVGAHFLFYSLHNMQSWYMNMGIGSTNQQELYVKTIKRSKVLLADERTISRFNIVVSAFHDEIALLLKENNNLVKQRDVLLPRLMSGKLEVK